MPGSRTGLSKLGGGLIGFGIGAVIGLALGVGPFVFGIIGAFIGVFAATPTADEAALDRQRLIAAFLEEARAAGDIDDASYRRLMTRVLAPAATAAVAPSRVGAPPPPPPAAAPTPPPPTVSPTPQIVAPPQAPPQPPPGSVDATPRPRRRRWSDRPVGAAVASFWNSLRADFAVQGLGSLGVLLVFTATLGFVIFAFSEVGAAFRPVAELMVPLVLFGMSHFLRTRRAPFMAAALEALGGAVTPVMVFAAFTDGASVPPDLERAALVATLTAASLALAGVYAVASRRRIDRPLAYLVAPLVWVAVAVAGMAINERASAATFALVLVAVAVSAWLVPGRSGGPLGTVAGRTVFPGLVLAYMLLLVFGLADAWPLWPMVTGGAAAVVALEGVRSRIPRIWIGEAAVLAITAIVVGAEIGAAWAGALTALVALAMVERWIASDEGRLIAAGFGAIAGAGLVAASFEAAPLLVVGLVAMAWGHTRRLISAPYLGSAPEVVAAVAPAVAAVALAWLTWPEVALLAVAGLLVAMAVFTRLRSDAFLQIGIQSYAAALGIVALVTDLVEVTEGVSAALALAAVAVMIVPGRHDVRVWLTSALAVEAWLMFTYAAGMSLAAAAWVLAGAGLAAVGAGVLVPGRTGGHVALAGHALGALGLGLVALEPARIGVLALWLAGWFVELAAESMPAPLQRLAGPRSSFDTSGLVVAPLLVGLPLLAMAIVTEVRPSAGLAGTSLVLAATAGVYGAVAGLPIWRRALTGQAVIAGVIASVGAVALAAGFDPLVAADRGLQAAALGSGIIGVVASARRVQWWMQWYAWTLSLPLALVAGLAAGLAPGDLHWVASGWGGALSIAALFADDLIAGRRESPSVRTVWLDAPAVLGALGAVGGLGVGLVAELAVVWPVALAATVWTATMAYLLRVATLSAVSWIMATLTYLSALVDAGASPFDEPLLMTWPSLVMLAAALVLPGPGPYIGRLDAPALGVGLTTSALAVGLGAATGEMVVTWAPIGAALIVVGVVKRRWIALVPFGSVLVIGAAADAGAWWLTSALALHTVAAAVVARLTSRVWAEVLQWLAAFLAAGTWVSLLRALDAGLDTVIVATAAASAVVGQATLVAVLRRPDARRHALWTAPWVTVALLALGLVGGTAVAEGVDLAVRWVVAAAVVAWLGAAVAVATVLDREPLRLFATAVLMVSVAAIGWASDLALREWTIWIIAAAVALTTLAATAARAINRLGWRPWLVAATGLLHVAGLGLSVVLLPDRSLLILSQIGLAASAVIAEYFLDVRGARYLAPGFAFGAWVGFISEAAGADVQWYTSPFAIAVIVVIEMVRRDRRRSAQMPVSPEELVIAELLTLALAVGPALVQLVAVDLRYGLLAVAWGVAIAVWGTGTRVRRRVLVGAAAAVLGALGMIAVPLAELLPEFRGPALWATVFVIGAVLIAVAATIEQTRRRVAELKTSFVELTKGWE